MDAPWAGLDGARALARAALANLESHRQRLDDLNVYPVPDGDTGTNMTLTAGAVVRAIEESTAPGPAELAAEAVRAALLGSRGNSGVILSQIVRGFAAVAGEHERLDSAVLARAFRSASDAAYAALPEPVEGTILTVARELAEEAEERAPEGLSPGELLRAVAVRGDRAVARTPDLLERLRAAGVVDAGGAGLVEIVRGLAAALTGDALPAPDAGGRAAAGPDALHQGLSRYRYCTTFAVAGEHLDAAALERELATFGDSLLVVGDETALKVHVHTDDHERAVALGERQGQILETEIADMHAQTREREERLAARLGVATLETGVVAVAAGAGNRALFESFAGTRVVDGGPSANPSTEELLEAVESLDAAGVIVLPNDPNAVASARQAAAQASRPVRVVPSRSVGAGLAAIVAHVPTLSLADNERLMTEVLEEIATGEVTRASRDATVDGVPVRAGDWLGLVDGRVVRSGAELQDVALAVVEAALDGRRSLVTLVTGEEQVDLGPLRAAVEERHPLVELEVHDGGQPHYPLLVVAE